ncbi:MAG: phospholipase D family protein [Proteobacteria bacterium]|nr:phospholipase D family protein [Pseudomonadota bacterium]
MKIYSDAKQLREALKEIKPTRIAVAYVGAGWEKYISLKHLKEIIVSPTLGSNPFAIEEIMRKKGEENVHFLDRLHTKLYLGENSALLGSPNLSDNGFSDSGKFEAGVVISESSSLKKLNDIFQGYKNQAINDYPTQESKIKKLKQLVKLWKIAIWHGVNTACNDEKSPSIGDYQLSQLNRIHIVWYRPGKIAYNKGVIAAVVPESNGIEPEAYFSGMLNFLEKDSINIGDWILYWHSREDGYPRENGSIDWMQVHHVIPQGVDDNPWTKLVCQSPKTKIRPIAPPFTLDTRTKSLIRDALNLGEFPALLCLNGAVWRLAPADKVVPDFLSYIQEQYLLQDA